MKVLVISDTHKTIDLAARVIKEIEDVDICIHLGDHYEDALDIEESTGVEMIGVKGNCDRGDGESEMVLDLEDHRFFITHGHEYSVKMNLNRIYYRALELGCDVVLFGHTHSPLIDKIDDVLIMNPGSISLPRDGQNRSYGIIEIDEEIHGQIIELK
ncbi:metallophosphoesterase family protein [Inediibacterium massiliense]|uniref:metallophosphoesterase family protein n=1 Tax=Inediibacterium massiliense TaxID=1658111 RepID=UPI0006B4FF61|nr:metallophosphoesterase [Inediibacterium massiliense]